MTLRVLFATSVAVCGLTACGDTASLNPDQSTGPNPTLPPPNETLIPTLKIAPAVGWPEGTAPKTVPGLSVTAFAKGLNHPRWLYVLPNGDVLVAETNAPERPDDGGGIKGFVVGLVQKQAGAAVPSPNRITLLRDQDGDGIAETRTVFLDKLNSPFGMALVGNDFFVANTDAIVRFAYHEGATRLDGQGTKVADLPGGPLNHHWTKGLIANKDGTKLYASVGSNSNVAENGIDKEKDRAAILEIEVSTGRSRIFAWGLRNPVGMAWEPTTGALWTVVNERDELGSDLVPDYLTSVREDAFYGWPYSYYGQHVDERVEPPAPDLVEKAIAPDYALGNHVAPLGLTFAEGATLGSRFAEGAFIGEHGSWNRDPLSGYKVVFVPFAAGKPNGKPVDVLTGFVNAKGDAQGRPVGVTIDRKGGLLVADDVGNAVWRVSGDVQRSAQTR
jgi:glucose/arabinose dehydrogenase